MRAIVDFIKIRLVARGDTESVEGLFSLRSQWLNLQEQLARSIYRDYPKAARNL